MNHDFPLQGGLQESCPPGGDAGVNAVCACVFVIDMAIAERHAGLVGGLGALKEGSYAHTKGVKKAWGSVHGDKGMWLKCWG